jgi:O-antigen/teichoic acid export membrane protein
MNYTQVLEKKSISKKENFLIYFSSKVVSVLLTILRGFLVPGYLGPKLYGIISLLNIVKIILGFSNLGFNSAFFRLAPLLSNKKSDEIELKILSNNVFSFLIISGIIGTIITFLLPLIFLQNDPEIQSIMVFCFSITAVQHFIVLLTGYYNTLHYINKNFRLISFFNILQPTLALIIILSTIFIWGIYGVFFAEFIAAVVIFFIYWKKTIEKPQFGFNYRKFIKTMHYAFPFFLADIGWFLIRFSDKTIILIYLSLSELGLFSFATNIAYNSRIITQSIGEVISPYFFQLLANENNLFNLAPRIKEYTVTVAAVGSLIFMNAMLVSPLIFLILPDYSGSSTVLKLLFILAYVISIPWLQSLLLGSPKVNKQKIVTIILYFSGFTNIILSIILLKIGYGLNGVALGTLIANIIQSLLYFRFSHSLYLKNYEFPFYLKVFSPLLLFVIVFVVHTINKLSIEGNLFLFLIANFLLLTFYFKEFKMVVKRIRN